MFARTKQYGFAVIAAIALLAGAAGPGCSSGGPGDYCQRLCDCVGCNDQQLQGCIDDAEDLYDDAVRAGCGAEADATFSCVAAEGACRSGQYDTDGCEYEIKAADKCFAASD